MREAEHRIGVHRHQVVVVGAGPLDAGRGDEMRVAGQAFAVEYLGAALDHVLVEDVDVADIEPGPHAIVAQRAALRGERADQLAEHFARLVGGRGGADVGGGAHPRAPQMAQPAHLDERVMMAEAAFDDRRVALDVVGEERDLGAVRRRLLDDRDRHRPFVGRAHQVR